MNPVLQKLHKSIASATRGITADELTRHPEGKWCAGEVLEHLYLTYSGTIKGLDRVGTEGKPLARTPTLADRVRTTVVVGLGYMPPGRKAPERSQPRGMPAAQVVSEIATRIAEMDALLTQYERQFGKRIRLMDHPVLGPLTAQQWRTFHWVHGRHHVKQIQRLREKPDAKP